MTITQIEYFIEAARLLNFNQAAKNLFVSQQVISNQIKALEEELNLTLFDRSNKRNIFLTQSGEILYESFSRLMKEGNEAVLAAREKDASSKTVLNVGIFNVKYVRDFSIDVMGHFYDKHPEIILKSETAGSTLLLEKLASGYLDFVITISSEMDYSHGFSYINLGNAPMELNIIMNKNNPLAARKNVTVEDIRGRVLYVYSREFSRASSGRVLTHLKRAGIVPSQIEYFNDVASMEIALNVGMGISISLKDMYQQPEKLKFYPLAPYDQSDMSLQYVLAWKKERNRKFADYFTNL